MSKYLVIENFGVRLKRLTEDKIELIRYWRNNPKISQYMEFRDYITEDMQKAWFKKINNDKNYFFIIEVHEKEIGLVDLKDIDNEKSTGESGIFLWNDFFLGKQISYRSLLLLHDFAFDTLHLHYLLSHILNDNIRSQKCYQSLGFVLEENQDRLSIQRYILNKERHKLFRDSVINKLKPLDK